MGEIVVAAIYAVGFIGTLFVIGMNADPKIDVFTAIFAALLWPVIWPLALGQYTSMKRKKGGKD